MNDNLRTAKVAIVIFAAVMSAVIFLSSNRFADTAMASEGGAPTGRTGAPGESTCTSCHNQTSGPGSFSIIAPTNYVPGTTYQIQVKHLTTDTTRSNWGFELIALTSANAMAGSFVNTTTNTRSRVSGTKTYQTQTTAGTFANQTLTVTWTMNWTAPATNVGNITFYGAGLQGDNGGDDAGDFTITATAVTQPQVTVIVQHGFSDFDGDGKSDMSVFRPSTGTWYLNRSLSGFGATQFGLATDKITPADFDGDNKTDIAIWRSGDPGVAAFWILNSSNNTVRIVQFGYNGDTAMTVADWDGDGKADPSVYRSGAQSYFYYKGTLNNAAGNITYIPWGATGDIPLRGDFDGDGKNDAVVFRPSNGVWYIWQTSTMSARYEYWGMSGDRLVPADYDGDGKTDIAVFRDGVWYIKQSASNTPMFVAWGLNSDTLVPADYDGDGKTDVAVYRAGTWYILRSSNGTMNSASFGNSTDQSVPNAFVQ